MIYYIDPINGGESSGLTPEAARKSYTDLELRPGDKVLFKRGSFIRDSLYRKPGTPDAYITYGAYGEGTNPVFCGSVDVSDPEMWVEERPNVWRYTGELESEACNFIFDGGRIGATLRWEEHLLVAQGDWHDTRMGMREQSFTPEETKVLLYSEGNPGKYYSHIECAVWGKRRLSGNVNCTAVEDLIFFGSGVHALAGGCRNMTVRRCSFLFIGGSVWNKQLKIRFGNAIEFWDIGEDILIEDCYFNNIFDSAITHQGSKENCRPARSLIMRNNLFVSYGMGAYEGRDVMSIDSQFNDNLCINAGGGFSGFGDTKPRGSEIYPQPMGHHLFMWRIPKATEGGKLEVKRNRFYNATGSAMYSILAPEADAQMELSDNKYYTTDKLLTRINGKNYGANEFDKYLSEYGEPGAALVTPDIEAEVAEWFEKTGCGRLTEKLITDRLPAQVYFVGSTDKDSLSYKVGEPMKFSLKLKAEYGEPSCARFAYRCESDDGSKAHGIVDAGESLEFEYTTSISRPGYVRLIVTACDEDGKAIKGCDVFEGGACAGFDEIKQTGKIPEDFDEFWNRVISTELDPIKPELIECEEFRCGDPGDVVYDVKLACPGKYPVSGYLRMPRNAEPKSLPIIVRYIGYGTSSAPIPPKAKAIQLTLNQHGIVNGKPFAYYAELAKTEFAGFAFNKEENRNPDTVYFKYMILRAIQALRYCKTLPEWDGVNITANGGSMGAFQSTSVAAREPGVTKLEIGIPWMGDLRGIEDGRLRGWRPDPAHGLDYYDTVSQATRVTCRTEITAGLGDYVCPPSTETALFHALGGETKLTMLQNRTHSYTAPEYVSYARERNGK